MARVVAAAIALLAVLLAPGGSVSADSYSNSGNITIEVGESATATWTVVNDDADPVYCSGGQTPAVFAVGGDPNVIQVQINGGEVITGSYGGYPTSFPCSGAGGTISALVQGRAPGTYGVILYRLNTFGQNNVSSSISVLVLATPVVSITGVTEGASIPTQRVGTVGCAVENLRTGTSAPAPVLTGNTGAYPRDVTATCTYQATLSAPSHTASTTFTVVDNSAPTVQLVVPQPVSVTPGTSTGVQVTASDVDGDVLTYTATQPVHGTVAPASSGTGAFTYTAGGGYVGDDSFEVSVSDGFADPVTTTVVVLVVDGDAPVITLTGGVQDGQTYARRNLPPAPDCSAVDDVDGPVACTSSGYATGFGTHTITYNATDAAGNPASRQVTYTVAERAVGPTATPRPPQPTPTLRPTERPRPTPTATTVPSEPTERPTPRPRNPTPTVPVP